MLQSLRITAHAVWAICLIATSTGYAVADPLPGKWQRLRDAGNRITEKACRGDKSAIQQLWRGATAGNPVLQNNIGWLRRNCRPFKNVSERQATGYLRQSATNGYPLAMSTYGAWLLTGEGGQSRDVTRGLRMLEGAVRGGFGDAATILSMYYADGKHLPRDLAKARRYLSIARREGVSAKLLADRQMRITRAEAAERRGSRFAGRSRSRSTGSQNPYETPVQRSASNPIREARNRATSTPTATSTSNWRYVWYQRETDSHALSSYRYITHGGKRVAGPFDKVLPLYSLTRSTNKDRTFVIGMCKLRNPGQLKWVRIIRGHDLKVLQEWKGLCLHSVNAGFDKVAPTVVFYSDIRNIRPHHKIAGLTIASVKLLRTQPKDRTLKTILPPGNSTRMEGAVMCHIDRRFDPGLKRMRCDQR